VEALAAPDRGVGCTKMQKPIDMNGIKILKGSKVRIPVAPNGLLSGLPEEDQFAIRTIIGKKLFVKDFDQYGHVELHFKDKDGDYHYIWVRPSEVEVIEDLSS
jgi:hypothetical protein